MLITLGLYILRELGKALGLSLLIFSLILLAFIGAGIIKDGAGVVTTLLLMPKLFPLVSPMVLPLTVITGTLICYGRFSSSNEFTACQAGGIHPGWVAAPAALVAVLAASITVFLNADVLTLATRSIEKSLVSEKTEIIRRRLSKTGSFTFQQAAICRLPRDARGRAGIDVTFFEKGDENAVADDPSLRWHPAYPHQATRLLARDHRIYLHEDPDGALYIRADLEDFVRYDLSDEEITMWSAERGSPSWPIRGGRGDDIRVSTRRLKFWGIGKLLRSREEVEAEFAKAEARLEEAPAAARPELERTRDWLRHWANQHTAELHLKLALSFSCLGFAAVAIPLGLYMRRDSVAAGFVVGITVALLFYVLVKALSGLVGDGRMGVWMMWAPNAGLLAAGAGLWIRAQYRD